METFLLVLTFDHNNSVPSVNEIIHSSFTRLRIISTTMTKNITQRIDISSCDLNLKGNIVPLDERQDNYSRNSSSKSFMMMDTGQTQSASVFPMVDKIFKDELDQGRENRNKRLFSAEHILNGNKYSDGGNSSNYRSNNNSGDVFTSSIFGNISPEPLTPSKSLNKHSKDIIPKGHKSKEVITENNSGKIVHEYHTSKLVPGLISKPPLSIRTKKSVSSLGKHILTSDDDMNAICTFLSLKYNANMNGDVEDNKEENVESNQDEKNHSKNFIEEYINDEKYSSVSNELKNVNYSTSIRNNENIDQGSTLSSIDPKNVACVTWVEKDIIENESQTDKILHELKREHGIIEKNLTDSFKIVKQSIQPWKGMDDITNISVVDMDELPRRSNLELYNSSEDAKGPMNKPQDIQSASRNCSRNDDEISPINQLQPESHNHCIKSKRRHDEKKTETVKPNETSHVRIGDFFNNKPNYSDILSHLNDTDDPVSTKEDFSDEKCEECSDKSIDDIVSILEALEEEDKKSQITMASVRKMVDMSLNPSICMSNIKEDTDSSGDIDPNSLENSINQNIKFFKHDESKEYSEYSVLISFLDEVDKNCSKSLQSAKGNAELVEKIVQSSIITDSVPKIQDLKVMSTEELSKQIIDLNLRVKDKNASIALLQQELSNLRDQILKQNKRTEHMVKDSLKQQKNEFEGTIKRHQKFIDQLLNDKKTLNQQCEGLIQEMRVLEDRYNSNTRALEHKHQVDMKKLKEMQIASEKLRREKWIDNKTRKIKEITVKSIEPEIHNMEQRHQQEIANLRCLHEKEKEAMELKGARKMQEQCEELRKQLVQEGEKTLAHERDIIRQRYEKMVECEEKGYQEQRRRLLSDHANRMRECEEREAAALVEKDKAIKQVRDETEDKLQAIMKKHSNEIRLLKESTQIQFETWQNNFKKQQMTQLLDKEKHLREQCRKERDKEIESVIERLENESSDNKMQIEQSAEARIRRIKEKYDKEILELESSEKESKSRYYEAKTKLLNYEETIIELRANIRQLENQVQVYKEAIDRYAKEKNDLKEAVKQEMNGEVEILEKELAQLKNSRDQELQKLHSRVKVSVARKDEILNELQVEHKALQEKCVYLEEMLEQQRKEYLLR